MTSHRLLCSLPVQLPLGGALRGPGGVACCAGFPASGLSSGARVSAGPVASQVLLLPLASADAHPRQNISPSSLPILWTARYCWT